MGVVGGILGAGVLSAGAQVIGSQAAASAQESAANRATDAQLAMFGITRASLAPYIAGGDKALNDYFTGSPAVKAQAAKANVWDVGGKDVSRAFGTGAPAGATALDTRGHAAVAARPAGESEFQKLTAPINMDQATLEATPGYQWTLGQGEKSTENALAARGLGESGAEIKGAEQYATGLASQTYQQQFQNALANKQMAYQAIFGPASLGESAAANQGFNATSVGGQIGSNITGAGNAAAGADIAGANAATGISNSLVNALLVQNQLGRSAASGGLY